MLKDFNIEKEAQGVDKAVIREFKKVQVNSKVLEIRFHWSGKGTTTTPKSGAYGILISAISIDSGKLQKPSLTVERLIWTPDFTQNS